MHDGKGVCMYVRTYVRTYVCMYVCMSAPFANIILLRPREFWLVFNEKKLIIFKKLKDIYMN